MTSKQQITKNIDLSQELMNYMIAKKVKPKPNYSYVIFTKHDSKLNKLNESLLEELVEEGRKVIRAIKMGTGNNQWIFTPIN